MEIKAIQTVYNGYRFRSRLEAKWAVFFNTVGIKYRYESEGFKTPAGWYLPDFWLPDLKWFVEVKGNVSDEIGIAKSQWLDGECPYNSWGCMLFGDLEYAECEHVKCECDGIIFYPPEFNMAFIQMQRLGLNIEQYNNAITKARQARFEHGECP